MRYIGRITTWYAERGYGFVTPDHGGERTFIHASAFECKTTRPDRGMRISYEVGRDQRNRPHAICVCRVNRHPSAGRTSASRQNMEETQQFDPCGTPNLYGMRSKHSVDGTGSNGAIVGAIVLGAIAFIAWHRTVLPIVASVYLAMSALAILLYGKDKFAAITNRWRTREATLHLVGLIGGWPGALFAQSYFRHKTKKIMFQSTFWVTVVLNFAGASWLMTQEWDGLLSFPEIRMATVDVDDGLPRIIPLER